MSIEYVEGTLSPGALVCVIPITDGVLDFQSIRLVPIRRNMSDNFTIPVADNGKYKVVAFDLENNNMSLPRMPMSVAADSETMVLILSNSKLTIVCQCRSCTFFCGAFYSRLTSNVL